MVLSVVVIGVFSAVGATNDTLSVLWWDVPGDFPNAKLMYKMIFSQFVIGFYLTWIAAILALISTASIFPDFLTGGAIDLYLSKPIGRGQLFLTKYVAGLLFVTLQVGVFSVAGFLVMGIRGHSWEPGLFLAIPIVVVFFSYLYGICALVGVMTRSTMAALLLTILAWFFIWTIDRADAFLTSNTEAAPMRQKLAKREADQLGRRIAAMEKRRAAETQKAAATQGSAMSELTAADADLFRLRQRRDRLAATASGRRCRSGCRRRRRLCWGSRRLCRRRGRRLRCWISICCRRVSWMRRWRMSRMRGIMRRGWRCGTWMRRGGGRCGGWWGLRWCLRG